MIGVVSVNGFTPVMGFKGSLGEGVSHVVVLDANLGLDFKVMYREGVRLYLFEDVM